jgi:hypothetical protein
VEKRNWVEKAALVRVKFAAPFRLIMKVKDMGLQAIAEICWLTNVSLIGTGDDE